MSGYVDTKRRALYVLCEMAIWPNTQEVLTSSVHHKNRGLLVTKVLSAGGAPRVVTWAAARVEKIWTSPNLSGLPDSLSYCDCTVSSFKSSDQQATNQRSIANVTLIRLPEAATVDSLLP